MILKNVTAELLDHVAVNVALAAADWPGVSSLRSDHIRAIRGMRDVCAACGEELDETRQLAHLVGEGRGGYGIVAFNNYVGHADCNDIDREVFGGDAFRIAASLARPDLVFRTIPSRKESLEWAARHDKKAARKARRLAARNVA